MPMPALFARRGRRALALVFLFVVASVLGASQAEALQIRSDHPRIWIQPADVPMLRARCAIVSGDNAVRYANQWGTHTAELASLRSYYNNETTPSLTRLNRAMWGRDTARVYSAWFRNAAVLYLLTSDPLVGQRINSWWSQVLNDSRMINGGSVGESISSDYWGKNASWAGLCLGYDYAHSYFTAAKRDSIALWILHQTTSGYEIIGGYRDGWDVNRTEHYYAFCWQADGVFGGLLTVGNDGVPYSVDDSVNARLDYTHLFKRADAATRDLNFCGTYAGYRPERIQEDVAIGLAWGSATDEDPITEYGYHYHNLDDYVMYMTRPNYWESDETGDSHDLGLINPLWIYYTYPIASLEANSQALWFCDRATTAMDQSMAEESPWCQILWNDRSIPRIAPTPTSMPLARYFGDLTPSDGHNSQYTFFRSSWSFAPGEFNSVHATYCCGPVVRGHDTLSNGHLAIFRGQDALTCSAGAYDGTSTYHNLAFTSGSISENTILVQDSQNPYVIWGDDMGDSTAAIRQLEGMQAPAPGTTGGGGVYGPEDPFDYRHEQGWVRGFELFGQNLAYLNSDLTNCYPNTRKRDLWPAGQTVESVTRQIAFVDGDFFVVCDRIVSVRPTAKKRIILHCPSEDGITLRDGSWTGGVPPNAAGGTPGQWSNNSRKYAYDRGGSRMFATLISPGTGTGRLIKRIGGPNSSGLWNNGLTRENRSQIPPSNQSYDFWLTEMGRNYHWVGPNLSQADVDRYYQNGWVGFWRVEIELTGARAHTVLHAYEAAPNTQSLETPIAELEQVDEGHVGCRIEQGADGDVLIFDMDEVPDDSVIYRSDLNIPTRVLIAGLIPGTYTAENVDRPFSARFTVGDSQAGVFDMPYGGSVHVRRVGEGEGLAVARGDANR